MSIFNIIRNLKNKKKIKFARIAEEWLELKKPTIKESSYANYNYYVYKYLMPEFCELSVVELERYKFNSFIEELLQQYEPKTVREIVGRLKSILFYAENEFGCNMKLKKIIAPKLNSNRIAVLSKREKGRLEKLCLRENTLKSLGVIISLYTGLRIGELCALKWKNINLDKSELYVKKTLQRIYDKKEKKTKILIGNPKTEHSVRSIPISNKIYALLKEIKKNYNDNDFLLTGEEEKYVEPRNYQKSFKAMLKKSRISSKYTFHCLRHTFATECIEVGMDAKSLSEILGHSSVEITLNCYVHSSYKSKKKFLEKL